jgi:hypothetical protein
LSYPPLVRYATQAEYRVHFERVYCRAPIQTFDGIAVRFRKTDFDHCFFESSKRNRVKDRFSPRRAERVDWIKRALEDPHSERYQGWDRDQKAYDRNRRVTIVMGNYVVVIALVGPRDADFVTAYVVDMPSKPGRPNTIDLIRQGPHWT